MICIRCKQNAVRTANASLRRMRQREHETATEGTSFTPPELIRGSRWRFKHAPSIEGILDAVHVGGYIHLEIYNDLGEFTWKSTIEHFLEAWEKIEPQSDLDREVDDHVKNTRRVPLDGQKSLPMIARPLTEIERIGFRMHPERREDGHDLD